MLSVFMRTMNECLIGKTTGSDIKEAGVMILSILNYDNSQGLMSCNLLNSSLSRIARADMRGY